MGSPLLKQKFVYLINYYPKYWYFIYHSLQCEMELLLLKPKFVCFIVQNVIVYYLLFITMQDGITPVETEVCSIV